MTTIPYYHNHHPCTATATITRTLLLPPRQYQHHPWHVLQLSPIYTTVTHILLPFATQYYHHPYHPYSTTTAITHTTSLAPSPGIAVPQSPMHYHYHTYTTTIQLSIVPPTPIHYYYQSHSITAVTQTLPLFTHTLPLPPSRRHYQHHPWSTTIIRMLPLPLIQQFHCLALSPRHCYCHHHPYRTTTYTLLRSPTQYHHHPCTTTITHSTHRLPLPPSHTLPPSPIQCYRHP